MASAEFVYRRDIDGLRGVAVVLVLLNHLLGLPAGGFAGVDLFFVISGFVITGALWGDAAHGLSSLKRFFWRRARRLLPSALLVLGTINLAARWFYLGPRIQQTHDDSLWALAFLANVHMADSGTDYFSQYNAPSLVQHYWSLAVEEQFYVVWPVVMLFLVWLSRRKHLGRSVLPIVGVLTLASFLYALDVTATQPERAYFSTAARAWELGVGAVIGLAVQGRPARPDWLQRLLSWAGLGLLAATCIFIDSGQPFPGAAALIPVGAAGLLLLCGGGGRPSAVSRGLSSRLPGYVGKISYPIYLWHWPVILIAREVWGGRALVYLIVPVVILALASLTHHLVEEPFRGRVSVVVAYRSLVVALKGNGPRRYTPVINVALASFALLLAITTTVTLQGPPALVRADHHLETSSVASSVGVERPIELPAQRALAGEISSSLGVSSWPPLEPALDRLPESGAPEWGQNSCLNVSSENEAKCVFGPSRSVHQAVVMGDSIAVSYMPGLRAVLEPLGWQIHILTQASCSNAVTAILNGKPNGKCDRHREWVIRRIQQLRPELVLLSNANSIDQIVPSQILGSPLETWRRGLLSTLRAIRDVTKHVVLLSPPPGTKNLQTCVTRYTSPSDCTGHISKSWNRLHGAEMSAAGVAGAFYVDTADWFCAYGDCPAVVGKTPVFIDGIHTTAKYSRKLEGVMRDEILPFLRP